MPPSNAGERSTGRTWSRWSAPGATFHKGQLVERPTDITDKIRKRAPKNALNAAQEKVAA